MRQVFASAVLLGLFGAVVFAASEKSAEPAPLAGAPAFTNSRGSAPGVRFPPVMMGMVFVPLVVGRVDG